MTLPPAAPPTAPSGGLLDGRYRVGPLLARGGMSTVYRGLDTRLDRPVAIKIMDPRLAADPTYRRRFVREARSAARIDHPHVVDVHDQGDDGARLFLVMELVEGGTLRDVLGARGALGVPAAFAVLGPVLAGLAQAHRLGMAHRDVKPENVLIGRGGEVKVADFGLVTAASHEGSAVGASHAGWILGTVAYLSPEQVATGAADARSDVYAAGVLLYELLTGSPPHTGDTALAVAYQHVNTDVPAPSAVAGDVPAELDVLVRDATSRDPARRPADAQDLLHRLHALAVALQVPAVAVPRPPHRPAAPPEASPDARPNASLLPYPGAAGTGSLAGAPAPAPIDGPDPDPDQTVTVPGGFSAVPAVRSTRAIAAGGVPRSTMALPGPDLSPPPGPPAAGPTPRRRRRTVLVVALVAVLAVLAGTALWWQTEGRFTTVPVVVGLDRAAAEGLLTQAGLDPEVLEVAHDTVPTGQVISGDPQPRASVPRGEVVRLTVSLGRPRVPEVAAGSSVADAERRLRDVGLTPVRASTAAEFSDTVPEGAVLRTDPAAGEPVAIGGPVTLVLSRGAAPPPPPQRVQVPFVVGERYADAAAALDDVGLLAEEQGSGWPFASENGRVIDQSPAAGTPVDVGTRITLTTL